jgi:hypothetical protein
MKTIDSLSGNRTATMEPPQRQDPDDDEAEQEEDSQDVFSSQLISDATLLSPVKSHAQPRPGLSERKLLDGDTSTNANGSRFLKPHAVNDKGQPVFTNCRNFMENDPRLQHLVTLNQQCQSFCTFPASPYMPTFKDGRSLPPTFKSKERTFARALRPLIRECVDSWLERKVIARVFGIQSFVSAMVAVKKYDDHGDICGVRFCIDPSNINKFIHDGSFPLSTSEEFLADMEGFDFVSQIDLKQAFTQLRLHKDARKFFCFEYEGNTYQFLTCPYGISVLSAHFQSVMMQIFADMQGFLKIYIDNLVVHTEGSKEKHAEHVMRVLQRLNEVNLRIHPGKLELGRAVLRILGRIITPCGSHADPRTVAALRDLPAPTKGKQLASLLGKATYIHSYLLSCGRVVKPLHAAKSQLNIKQTEEYLEAWSTFREILAANILISFPTGKGKLIVQCDASQSGTGAILIERTQEGDIIIATASRVFTTSESRMDTHRQELLGVVWSISRFHTFLLGRHFTVESDHKSLIKVLNGSSKSRTIHQWVLALMEYHFEVTWIPSRSNTIADLLSRNRQHSIMPTEKDDAKVNALPEKRALTLRGFLLCFFLLTCSSFT